MESAGKQIWQIQESDLPYFQWGILPCRFAVCPLGGGILSRSNCLHDQKHFVPLCRVSLIGSLPTSENCTISVAPLCES